MKETKDQENGHPQEEMDNQAEQHDAAGQGDSQSKFAEMQDKYLRLYSDFENFRKRANKEKVELIQNANKDLLLELLPVYDDFERAVSSMEKVEDVQAITDGIKFIFNKFQRIMQQSGLKEIDAVGADFDPEYHDAITKIPAPTPELKGKVVDQVQKGYMLNDKIIRHSKVVVGE